ncbi:MAG: rRNA maturation RNase YbeY, partial [Dehalococcoidia bacterium]|nr:rRNA maturation RNase YbeY [Dehalococcoidia bacterium]
SVAPPAELSVVIAGDETVRELNRRYRGVNETTDVLSFGLEAADRFVTPDGMRRLGEIVISLPTALRQAETAGHSLRAELEHLLVHGILHVLGYDHESPRSEKAMRAREEELLGWPVH